MNANGPRRRDGTRRTRRAAERAGTELPYALRKTARPVVGPTDVADTRNGGAPLADSEVIDALERYLAASTQQAEDQQAAGRIAQAEQDERDREQIAQYRRQFPGVAVPGT